VRFFPTQPRLTQRLTHSTTPLAKERLAAASYPPVSGELHA
jgi:hypothetical protein